MRSQDPTRKRLSAVPDLTGPPPFTCAVLGEDGVATIVATGELDLGTSPVLDACMQEQRDLGAGTLVVDFTGVSFIDSSAIHLLLTWADEADRSGLELRVVPGGVRVQKVFEMTGVLERLTLLPARQGEPAADLG